MFIWLSYDSGPEADESSLRSSRLADLSLAWGRGAYLSRAEQAFVDFVVAHREVL